MKRKEREDSAEVEVLELKEERDARRCFDGVGVGVEVGYGYGYRGYGLFTVVGVVEFVAAVARGGSERR